jgi:hypothetical protein
VWFVEPDISAALLDAGGPKLTTTLITATDKELLHTEHLADKLAKKGRSDERIIDLAHIKDLPKLVRDPQAVLYDTTEKGLVYVFEVDADGKSGKWAVRINLQDKKSRMMTNSLRSGAYVDTVDLNRDQYKLLKGRL